MTSKPRKSLALVHDKAGLLAKIKAHVTIDENGCHIWHRARDFAGYGTITFEGRTWSTHRLMYQFANGPITAEQADLFVLHQCDVAACCNPAHLTLGTPAQNAKEKADRCRIKYGSRRVDGAGRERRIGTVFYEYRGEVKSLKEWADMFGVNLSTLDSRFMKGLPEESISLPASGKNRSPSNVTHYRRFSGVHEVEEYLAEKARQMS